MTDSLDVALGDATRRDRERNPKSARLARAAAEVMPGGNTRSVLHTEPFGIRVDGAEGAVLTTAEGDQQSERVRLITRRARSASRPVVCSRERAPTCRSFTRGRHR